MDENDLKIFIIDDFLLIGASIIFAGLLLEIGLRIAGVTYPIFHRLETLRGWSPQPSISGVWMTEGKALIENNQEGFRDRDYPLKKPPHTFRVTVLGDSMSEALAVPWEKHIGRSWKTGSPIVAAVLLRS